MGRDKGGQPEVSYNEPTRGILLKGIQINKYFRSYLQIYKI
jgi:hypothetical protein